jgi:hypothetical protein
MINMCLMAPELYHLLIGQEGVKTDRAVSAFLKEQISVGHMSERIDHDCGSPLSLNSEAAVGLIQDADGANDTSAADH